MIVEKKVAFLGGFAALIVWFIIAFIKKKATSRKILVSLFIVYITCVISITVFPIEIDPEILSMTDKSIVLIPFSTISELFSSGTLKTIVLQIVGNVLLTVPYGISIPFLSKAKKWYIYLIYALVFPVIIELIQLIICLSTSSFYRTVDVDDIILNFIGALVGYGVYKILPEFIKNYFGTAARKSET